MFGLVEFHYRNERFNHMKKVLIGMAAASVAVVGMGVGPVSAAPAATNTIFQNLVEEDPSALQLLLAADLDESVNDCAGPVVTVFIPNAGSGATPIMSVIGAAATALGTTTAALIADTATLKGLISLHVTSGYWSSDTLLSGLFKSLPSAGGQPISISGSTAATLKISGNAYVKSQASCNGIIHYIGGVITPTSTPKGACGANFIGQCPTGTSSGTGTGSGLPKTGSESMALTYAALASLIAGAGVLVIRRRSIA